MSSEDSADPGVLGRLRAVAPEVVAGAGGGLIGYAVSGPVGAVVGNAAPAALVAAWKLGEQALEERLHRASRVLEAAAAVADLDLDALVARAGSDAERLELTGRVLEAASRAVLTSKIQALGRVLAAGLQAKDTVDEAFILASALDDVEAPHVQLLDLLASPPPANEETTGGTRNGWSRTEAEAALPGYGHVLPALMSALERHGLILNNTLGSWGGMNRWGATALGHQCLELLRDGVSKET